MTRRPEDASSRRDFLKLVATGAPAVAAASVVAGDGAEAAAAPDPTSNRMQDTAHIRAYFDSVRF